jgi:catechol 2,3-dioxygenase-like lactoylglutathione lyase family enzyme
MSPNSSATSTIAVADIESVRYSAPDLDLMESFLRDFGLERALRTDSLLYMRGRGSDPFVHVTERGPPRGVGFALKAQSLEDLERLARHVGTDVIAREAPGGGRAVDLSDPDGNRIEIVWGVATREMTLSRAPFAANVGPHRARANDTVRTAICPSEVLRLGHVALFTAQFAAMRAFYHDLFGLRDSDSYYGGHAGNTIASFMHCGLGKQLVDHHTLALIGNGRTGYDHSAFEVLDMDDLMRGNHFLAARGTWKHSWGVGRHFQGSQLFDYWRDPFGNKIEHWTDGDLVNDDYQKGHTSFDPATDLAQWGPPLSPDFLA